MIEEKLTQALEAVNACVEELRAGLATFHNAVRLQGARHLYVAGTDGPVLAVRAAGRLLGWSFHETAGAPATIVLRDAQTPAGDPVAFIDLTANASETIWLAPVGVSLTYGLYVDVAAGAAEGVVYLGTDQA